MLRGLAAHVRYDRDVTSKWAAPCARSSSTVCSSPYRCQLIRAANIARLSMRHALHVTHVVLLEDGGRNTEQLDRAYLDALLTPIHRTSSAAVSHGKQRQHQSPRAR